jgi:hypothetical protein
MKNRSKKNKRTFAVLNRNIITTVIFCLVFSMSALSQSSVFSSQSGNWNSPATWVGGTVPAATDTVFIQLGDTVKLDISGACFNLFIQSGAVLYGDSANLEIKGNWMNDGDFSAGTGLVKFSGSNPQQIGGTVMTNFKDIEINSTSTVSLAYDQYLTGILYLNSGMFVTTGYEFTLFSDYMNTASIAEIQPGADIVGPVTVQRYVNSGAAGWRFMGSPVRDNTILNWDDDFQTSGFPGASLSSSFSSVNFYNESAPGIADSGFVSPAQVTDTIKVGSGYRCYINSAPLTIDMSGIPAKFTHTFDVSYTTSNGQGHDGWNLVSNPYPSSIDWNATGWSKTGLNAAVYTWNPDLEQFCVNVDGVAVNGGSSIIPSGSAFWVKAHQNNPALISNESVKVNQNPVFQKSQSTQSTTKTLVKLTLGGGNNYSDETYVCFSPSASNGFDTTEDAYKLFSDNPVVGSISTMIDSSYLAVNCFSDISLTRSIPVRVKVGITGKYIIARDTNLALPAGTCVFLEDLALDTLLNFSSAPSYSFIINDTTTAPRFVLHIGAPIAKSSIPTSCFYSNNGQAILTGGIASWSTTWKDELGNTIAVHNNVFASDTLKNLSSGKYIASVTGTTSTCNAFTDTIIVAKADTIKALVTLTNPLCSNLNSGAISVNTVSGGEAPYSFSWSNGSMSSSISNLNTGVYTLVVSDAKNCKDTLYLGVNAISGLSVNFAVTADTLLPVSSYTVGFNNYTNGYSGLSWDFGDGNTSSLFNPVHSYTVPGIYNISLVANDSICADTAQATVVVLSPTLIDQKELANTVLIYNSDNGPQVRFNLQNENRAEIRMLNLEGKVISEKTIVAWQNTESTNTEALSAGLYLLEVKIDGKSMVKKFTK